MFQSCALNVRYSHAVPVSIARVATIVPILDENVIVNSFFLISRLSADTFLNDHRSIIGKPSIDEIADTDRFFKFYK